MKNRKRLMENAIHGIFLILGLITVGCVLLITIYLVISGIPAIRKIGVLKFLLGKSGLLRQHSRNMAFCLLSSQVFTVRLVQL